MLETVFTARSGTWGVLLAGLLLAMSVTSWAVMVYKCRLLWRVRRDVTRSVTAFWQAPDLGTAQHRLAAFDRDRCVLALLQSCQHIHSPAPQTVDTPTLSAAAPRHEQLTRCLRDALQHTLRRLMWGQTLLASVGATAPFVGLLGTVWGMVDALGEMGQTGVFAADSMAGPVGEALVMTALGLGVAIPAVLGYNLLGRQISQIESELEGFAHDLRALWAV